MAKAGRPRALDDINQREVCALVSAGCSLVDVALAVALKEESDRAFGKRDFVDHSSPLEYFSAEPIGRGGLWPVSSFSSPANTSAASTPESESPESPGSWEEAFNEVFASVFK